MGIISFLAVRFWFAGSPNCTLPWVKVRSLTGSPRSGLTGNKGDNFWSEGCTVHGVSQPCGARLSQRRTRALVPKK
jgi:hypothetical protein